MAVWSSLGCSGSVINFLVWCWLRKCCWSKYGVTYCAPHSKHSYLRILPECLARLCANKFLFWKYDKLHTSHLNFLPLDCSDLKEFSRKKKFKLYGIKEQKRKKFFLAVLCISYIEIEAGSVVKTGGCTVVDALVGGNVAYSSWIFRSWAWISFESSE